MNIIFLTGMISASCFESRRIIRMFLSLMDYNHKNMRCKSLFHKKKREKLVLFISQSFVLCLFLYARVFKRKEVVVAITTSSNSNNNKQQQKREREKNISYGTNHTCK